MTQATTETRVPPQDMGAEQALLGAMLIDNSIIPEVNLLGVHFYKTAHGHIYQAMKALDTAGTPVDLVTFLEHLTTTGILEDVGGNAYIASLAVDAVTSVNHEAYADIIREKADRRRVLTLCRVVAGMVHEASLEDIQDKLYIELGHRDIEHKHIRDVVKEVSAQVDRRYQARRDHKVDNISGISTGFFELDAALDGLQLGELTLIGGYTGMGKSALGGQIARHAGQFVPVHINNLEMIAERNVGRMVADAGNIESWKIRKAMMRDMDEWSHFHTTLGDLSQLDITFDDTSMKLQDIQQSMIRAIKRGAKFFLLDYLQLVSNPAAQNREREIASVTKMLKQMAKKYRVAVLCIVMLNRELVTRTNKRPLLSDIKGSSDTEHDADVIIFVHREFMFSKRPEDEDKAELIIAKGRDIGLSTIRPRWDAKRARFLPEED